MSLLRVLATCFILATLVRARPASLHIARDNTPSQSNSVPVVAIVAPLVLVAVFGVAVIIFKRYQKRQRANSAGARGGVRTPAASGTTAEAILAAASAAGGGTTLPGATSTTTNANGTTAATTGAPRGRRTRRTPSQISTKSLPEYMENPGDEEMVLVRRGMEEQIEEGDEDPSQSSIDISRSNDTYGHDPQSSVDVTTPFMQTTFNPSHDMPSNPQSEQPRNELHVTEIPIRQSFETIGSGDTHDSMESGSGLLAVGDRSTSHLPVGEEDPRGEAPPYFEHVDPVTPPVSDPSVSAAPSAYPRASPPASQSRNRISTSIRNLFGNPTRNRASIIVTNPESNAESSALSPVPMTDTSSTRDRADTTSTSNISHTSSPSLPSLLLSRSRSPSGSRLGSLGTTLHRPNTNNSSNFTHHRNRSGSSSLNVPNNMSSISLNSISAPLAHTATRTDFTFPKAGPNAKQLAFVSSREKLGKFGVPFGSDARAAARDAPPPFPADASGPSAASGSRAGSRLPPATWWQKLTNPAGASSPPKPADAELPDANAGDDLTGLPPLPPSRSGTLSSVRTTSTYATAMDPAHGLPDEDGDEDDDYSPPTPTIPSPTTSASPAPSPATPTRKATVIIIPEPENNGSLPFSPPRVDLIPATPIRPFQVSS